jgi:Cu-Zn family superoxide dismutase
MAALLLASGLTQAPRPSLAFGERATALLKDRSGKDVGTVSLFEATGGVLIRVKLNGLPPGPHAVRILDAGRCEGDFATAGDIFNPHGAKHGFLSEAGPMAGDLPNIFVASDGQVEAELFNHLMTLGSGSSEAVHMDEDGAAVVVFERASDHFSEPEGNAGMRIACGVLAPAK